MWLTNKTLWMATALVFGSLITLNLCVRQDEEKAALPVNQPRLANPVERPSPKLASRTTSIEERLGAAFTATEDTAAHQAAIRDVIASTGTSTEPWTVRSRDAIVNWHKSTAVAEHTQIANVDCFQHACIATVSFSSRHAYADLADSMVTFDKNGWTGPVMRSSPMFKPNGTVTVEWALMRSEGDTPR
jgi:hypothetical protein